MTEAAGRDGHREMISLLSLANAALRRRRLIVALTLGVATLVVAYAYLRGRTYRATASFVPQAPAGASRLSGLAAQFGFAVPGGEASQSPEFYAGLLTSRALLRGVVATPYQGTCQRGRWWTRRTDSLAGDLVTLFEVDATLPADMRRDIAMRALRERMTVSTARETGLVSFSVTHECRELAAAIARRVLELVNEFNLQTRQSQAAAERRFVEERLAEEQRALREAEGRLERFLQQNRAFANSPQLQFQRDRLQRDVSLRQQVVLSLSQSFEQSRIEQVRNTPVVTVVEQPEVPAFPVPRRLPLMGLLGLALGAVLGAVTALVVESFAQSRSEAPDEFAEFQALKAAALGDIRRITGRRRTRDKTGGA